MGKKGGFIALGIVYLAAGALSLADGPFPFGDAVAIGFLLAIPDGLVYAIGSGTEDLIFGEDAAVFFSQQSRDGVRYYV